MADYKFPGDDPLTKAEGTLREQAAETASDLRGSMSDMAQKAGATWKAGGPPPPIASRTRRRPCTGGPMSFLAVPGSRASPTPLPTV